MSTLKVNNLSSKTAGADLNIQINGSTVGTFDGTSGLLGQIKCIQQSASLIATYSSSSTAIPFDDTIPQNTEGTEFTTLSFTPLLATSTLEIEVTAMIGSGGAVYSTIAMFVDSTADAIWAKSTSSTGGGEIWPLHGVFRISSGSTSARTYKMRFGATSGTMYLNGVSAARRFGGVSYSGFTIKELV